MAISFTLQDKDSNLTYDLYGGTLYTSAEMWRTSTSSGAVSENISLSGSGTNAAIRTAFDTLDDIKAQVVRYANDPNEDNAIYMYKTTDGETAKRTLILDMDVAPGNTEGISSLLEGDGIKATLSLKHPDFWEKTSTTTLTGGDLANIDWTSPIGVISSTSGNVDARIERALFAHSSGTIGRVWFGMRPRRVEQAALAGHIFGSDNTTFECEFGTPDVDTVLASDSGGGVGDASPNGSTSVNIHRCNFTGTSTMARRSYSELGDHVVEGVSYLMDAWAGRYKVLLRYKLSASPTTEVLVQLRYGMQGNSTLGAKRPIYLTGGTSGYDVIEIGTVNMPPWGDFKYGDGSYSTEWLGAVRFELWAELVVGTAGTSTFDLDALILIPDDHSIYIEGASLTGANQNMTVHTAVNGQIFTVEQDASGFIYETSLLASPKNWYVPHGTSDFVICCARGDDTHQMTDEIDLSMYIYHTYFNYVG